MTADEVEQLVRGVIVHGGLPFAILSVIKSPAGWDIHVRGGTGAMIQFTVFAGRPLSMRIAIQEKLEAAL